MGSQQMIPAAAAVDRAASGDRAVRTSFARPLRRAADAFILGKMPHQATEKLRRISSDLRSFSGRRTQELRSIANRHFTPAAGCQPAATTNMPRADGCQPAATTNMPRADDCQVLTTCRDGRLPRRDDSRSLTSCGVPTAILSANSSLFVPALTVAQTKTGARTNSAGTRCWRDLYLPCYLRRRTTAPSANAARPTRPNVVGSGICVTSTLSIRPKASAGFVLTESKKSA